MILCLHCITAHFFQRALDLCLLLNIVADASVVVGVVDAFMLPPSQVWEIVCSAQPFMVN
jgi:hypothetical protein